MQVLCRETPPPRTSVFVSVLMYCYEKVAFAAGKQRATKPPAVSLCPRPVLLAFLPWFLHHHGFPLNWLFPISISAFFCLYRFSSDGIFSAVGNLFLSLKVIVFSCEHSSLFLWAHSNLTFPLDCSIEAACFDVSSSPLLNPVVFSGLYAVTCHQLWALLFTAWLGHLMLLGFLYSPDTPLPLLFHFLVLFMLYPRSQCRLPSQAPRFACRCMPGKRSITELHPNPDFFSSSVLTLLGSYPF